MGSDGVIPSERRFQRAISGRHQTREKQPVREDLSLVIGNKNYSSWSLRPWFLLKQLRITFTEIRVPLYTPTFAAEIAPLSPTGLVPALHHGDLIISDSLAITEFINDVLAPGRVWPSDVTQRAIARGVCAQMHSGFTALRAEMPMNCRRVGVEINVSEQVEQDIDRICALWRDCRRRYGSQGPWLFGEFSAADAFYAPVALRFNTYVVPVDPTSNDYIDTILAADAIRAWVNAARNETEIIESAELPSL